MRFTLVARMISLTSTETQFIHHLDSFSRQLSPPVECRIAGGWVRDKLLSLPSSDLDVALSIPSGHSFAVSFVDYLKSLGIPTGSVGKVEVNPEQSKHLETGTTRILGLECDFVGLRSETYADSRIPTEVRLGTPLEDASRRDLTINALFYNVHSKEIEDYTGKGLNDLAKKIARTPLQPQQTFKDDPLRVVRCVRFASRFGLAIDSEVSKAIQDEEIKAALSSKVSKERIGIEVHKMLQKTPRAALLLIDELGLHKSIFASPLDAPRDCVVKFCDILTGIEQRHQLDEMLWFAAATSPFRNLVTQGKRPMPAPAQVISEGLKLSNEIRDGTARLFEAAKLIDPNATRRSAIGLTLQHPAVRPWKRSIVWAIAEAIYPAWTGSWDDRAQAIVDEYDQLIDRIDQMGLEGEIDRPPLLDGKSIQKLLNIKPSPVLAPILSAIKEWQLDHPTATKEDCARWLQDKWEHGGKEEWETIGSKRPR